MGHRTTKTNHRVKVHKTVSCRVDFFYYAFRNILIIILPLFTISVLVLSLPHSSATNSSADHLDFSIPVSCTLSSNIESAHSATLLNGTYKDNIGKTILTTYCNDQNGYTIYASAMSKNSSGQSVLVSSDSSTYDIITGTATSGSDSAWAMKLNNIEDDTSPTPPTIEPGYLNTYTVVPNTWTKVVSKSNGTVNSQTGSSFTTTYAVYTSTTQPAGNYIGLVRYMLLHDNQTIPEPIYFMQDVAFWKDDLALNQSIQAIDERDGKKYWVTKLADGNVWMTQNLDFSINANTTLNSTNTDLNVAYDLTTEKYSEYDDGYTVENGIIYWKPTTNATTIGFLNTGPITGWRNNNTAPYSASKTDNTETGHESLGNWYNWTAAIASNNSSSLTQDTLNDTTKNPQNSICPKGWRLPTISNQPAGNIDSTNEFARLNYLYNGNSANSITGLTTAPLYMNLAGVIESSAAITTRLVYLSSTVHDSTNAYFLEYYNNNLKTNVYFYKSAGRPIRCIAR